MTVGELFGVGGEAARARAGFDARLRAAGEAAWRELTARGGVRDGAAPPELSLPAGFADVLAAVVAVEEREGTPRAEALRRHYLDFMPRLRVEQLATRAEPNLTLLHRPLDWRRLPRLAGAIDRLFALLAGAGVTPSLLGCASAAALRARYATLGQLYERTYYGGFMPLLYGWPADLAFFGRALAAGGDFEDAVDRHLTAPILHELAHLDPSTPALFPLYLDECVAGWLGVRVLREFAYPAPGADHALYAAPWFAQVGQALVRACGADAVVRAHAGAEPWESAIQPLLTQSLARAGRDDYLAHRQPHLLSDSFRPDRWIKLIQLAAAGERASLDEAEARPWRAIPAGAESPLDAEILDDALAAMCLRNTQVDRHFVVASAPPRAPIAIDLDACRVSTAPGEFDPAPPAYWFPPAVSARLRARGIAGYTVEVESLDALPAIARLILAGEPRGGVERGAGFMLRCNMRDAGRAGQT
ncbi:MAG TPA: hypothetical protein VFF06_35245 [Polyangia bacterium]|nr:hypothetical protein [Polyangia bacterium]